MPYVAAEARQELLDALAAATDQLGVALAALAEAFEELDEFSAERLEDTLFRPVQAAYGRAQRTHAQFAERHGLAARTFSPQLSGARPGDARAAIDHALAAIGATEEALAALQDSMMPVEVGDPELRAGLADVRRLIAPLPGAAREIVRTLGR